MTRHLNLIKTDFEELEKRVLPRFPLSYLIFKIDGSSHAFEVKDVSWSGMQVECKNAQHGIKRGDTIRGHLHWQGENTDISGHVRWLTESRLGIEFQSDLSQNVVRKFFSLTHFAQKLKPVHLMGQELPPKLKIWLRADGPAELFVWQHPDGKWQSFQMILMENFLEWVDGVGLKTGRVMSKRDVDTPLISEDEFVFHLDQGINPSVVQLMTQFVDDIDAQILSQEDAQFLLRKMSY